MLAALVVIVMVISVIGVTLGPQTIAIPADIPIGNANVGVNVIQSPAKTTAQVSLFVLPR